MEPEPFRETLINRNINELETVVSGSDIIRLPENPLLNNPENLEPIVRLPDNPILNNPGNLDERPRLVYKICHCACFLSITVVGYLFLRHNLT
jgi:hypothetical protein